jgi:two-component system, sensor histidine kinase and response regulator
MIDFNQLFTGWLGTMLLLAILILPTCLFAWLFLHQRHTQLELQNSHRQDQSALEILQKQLHHEQDTIRQLRHSTQLLQFALKGSGDGVWDWDHASGRVLYNDRYRALLGYLDEDEFPDDVNSWRQLVHPDDTAEVVAGIKRYFNCIRPPGSPGDDPVYMSEYRMRCKDGTWKWFISRGRVIKRDGLGKPLRMTGTLSDITAQKNAEQLQMRTLLDASPDIMLLAFQSGIIHYANPPAGQLFGYTAQELIGLNVDQLVPSELRTRHQHLRTQYFAVPNRTTMAPYRQINAQRKDGKQFPIEVSLTPITMLGQSLIIVTLRDMTERKKTEMALRQSEERLHEIIDAMPVSIYVKNSRSEFILMNRACEIQIGIPFKALQGSTGERFFSSEQMQFALGNDQKAFLDHRIVEFEEVIWNFALEESRFVRTYKKPIYDAAGEPGYLIGVSIDITENRRAERALIELNEHLEERVALRTKELDLAKKVAEEASAAKGSFLANMSHEIRTPMNGVIGLAYLALKTQLTPKQRDYLEKIHAAGEHLLGIIDDVLDFSKIEAGKLEIESVNFTIDKIIQNLHNLVAAKAASKGLYLHYSISPEVPRLLCGDPLRVAQILINFTNNAIKFSQNGTIHIRINLLSLEQQQCRIRMEVQDCGIGISSDNIGKLFQSFQQADTSTTRQYGGTGLGLVICKQLAELMGGEIGVESVLGSGSTFWFNLPMGLSSPVTGDEQQSATLEESLDGIHILLVEDNAFNQQIATELLEGQGAVVCLANNGQEALDLLRKTSFDCVLMDVQMPVLDGYSATRLIRQDPRFPTLPVIAMTANASNEDRQLCLSSGMNDFISKPIHPQIMYTTIHKWVNVNVKVAKKVNSGNQTMVAETPGQLALADDHTIIDLSVLDKLLGGDPEKVHKFALKFYDNASHGLDELDAALVAADLSKISALGHRLKSSARSVGASLFADLCETLEHLPEEADIKQTNEIARQLRQILMQIHKIIHNC